MAYGLHLRSAAHVVIQRHDSGLQQPQLQPYSDEEVEPGRRYHVATNGLCSIQKQVAKWQV